MEVDCAAPSSRNLLFVSHANPEDNEFALWISLQLAQLGYPVWCDLTRLLGGESFWDEAEDAIRSGAAKFLYVLSRASNEKQGVKDELHTAKSVQRSTGIENFIIPLAIDDLRPANYNIAIQRLNAIFFRPSWASGLAQLLDVLERDGVKKCANFAATPVSEWWKSRFPVSAGIVDEPEQLVSNWYPLDPLPPLFFHRTQHERGLSRLVRSQRFPAVLHKDEIVTFAPESDFDPVVRGKIRSTAQALLWTSATSDRLGGPGHERRTVMDLLRQAWRCFLASRELPTYSFARQNAAMYFRDGMLEDDRVQFVRKGKAARRKVIGYKTISRAEETHRVRYWHFGLEARPALEPQPCFIMKPHVLFSDDKQNIWESKPRLHRARRSHCRGWWNDLWRDLVMGSVQYLAGDGEAVLLPLSSELEARVSASPIFVRSPFSYDDSLAKHSLEESDDDHDREAHE